MAYIMDTDDNDVIHATTHGIMSRSDLNFLRDRMDRAVRSAGSMASDYLKVAREKLENFDLNRLRDKVEAMQNRFDTVWNEDRIMDLFEIKEFQQAKSNMRPYLMAEPTYRKLFHEGRADGFGDLYIDDEPGKIGRDHTKYREIYNGSHQEVDGEDQFVSYLDVIDEHGDADLNFEKKISLRWTLAELKEHTRRGKQDPLSPLKKTF